MESRLKTDLKTRADANDPVWQQFFTVAQEIVLAESLTRVFFAVTAARTTNDDIKNISDDTIADQLSMSQRILQIKETAPVVVAGQVAKFDELVELAKRVTDLMLSQLPDHDITRPFAVDANAFDEFLSCAGPYQEDVIGQANVALGLAFSEGIQNLANPTTENEDINEKILVAMLQFCLLYTSPSPRDQRGSRMPSSA